MITHEFIKLKRKVFPLIIATPTVKQCDVFMWCETSAVFRYALIPKLCHHAKQPARSRTRPFSEMGGNYRGTETLRSELISLKHEKTKTRTRAGKALKVAASMISSFNGKSLKLRQNLVTKENHKASSWIIHSPVLKWVKDSGLWKISALGANIEMSLKQSHIFHKKRRCSLSLINNHKQDHKRQGHHRERLQRCDKRETCCFS